MKKSIVILFVLFTASFKGISADEGYKLWLKYEKISDESLLEKYQSSIKAIMVAGKSETHADCGKRT